MGSNIRTRSEKVVYPIVQYVSSSEIFLTAKDFNSMNTEKNTVKKQQARTRKNLFNNKKSGSKLNQDDVEDENDQAINDEVGPEVIEDDYNAKSYDKIKKAPVFIDEASSTNRVITKSESVSAEIKLTARKNSKKSSKSKPSKSISVTHESRSKSVPKTSKAKIPFNVGQAILNDQNIRSQIFQNASNGGSKNNSQNSSVKTEGSHSSRKLSPSKKQSHVSSQKKKQKGINVQKGSGTSKASNVSQQAKKDNLKKENLKIKSKDSVISAKSRSNTNKVSTSVIKSKKTTVSKERKSPKPQVSTKESNVSIAPSTRTIKKDISVPQIQKLLANCECYMNWSQKIFSDDTRKHLINEIEILFLEPPPSGECIKNEVLRYKSFECIASLGALCYFQIESSQFQGAKETIDRTKEFVDESVQKGFFQKDFIYSLDYVWDFLRLYASKREWDLSNQFMYFPEMNLESFIEKFESLKAKIKAGVYGLKSYYLSIIGAAYDKQIDTLRKAISFDHEYFEWHCCLQKVLRIRRKTNGRPSSQPKLNYSMADELQEGWTAIKLAPNHPKCILGGMQVLADMATIAESGAKWNVFSFGPTKFYNMTGVVKFLKEEATKVRKHFPMSLSANMILADIFMTELPRSYRDFKFGKECLDRCLEYHPESAKANLRLGQYYLNVERNFKEAELYFDTAFSLYDRNFTGLMGLLYLMMRVLVKRQKLILDLIKAQLESNNKHWNPKQSAKLRYLRGLTLFGISKPNEAFEEFIAAYELDENSLGFHELPAVHQHFGWPGWPTKTLLTFGNLTIEAEVIKEELLQKETDTNETHKLISILSKIIKMIHKAEEIDKQKRAAMKNHASMRSLPVTRRGSYLLKLDNST